MLTVNRLRQMTQAICFNCLIVSGLGVIVLQGGGEICDEVIKVCPEFKEELVPMCVRNGGVCYEMFPCGERNANG